MIWRPALAVIVVAIALGELGPEDSPRSDRKSSTPASDWMQSVRALARPSNTSRCALSGNAIPVGTTLPGCVTLASDSSAESDPVPLWGEIACEEDPRAERPTEGGDTSPAGDGSAQGDTAFRRLRVVDGDNEDGERCELGYNDHRTGPTDYYREGQRRVTFLSLRLPSDFPLGAEMWQVLMQMKQTQPAENGGGTPVLALEAWNGRWRLRQSDSSGPASDAHEIWSAPVETGVWTRFAFDITYSQDPSIGNVKVYADLNGDSDFEDSEEQSPIIRTYTLKAETSGENDDGLDEGESIPSHLRVGLYHDPAYPCPAPSGCHVDVDNVQVMAP